MDLFVLRHGKAGQASPDTDDIMRALTSPGRREIRIIARWMRREGIEFDVIASSPLIRASETAGIVARMLDQKDKLVMWDDLAPGGDFDSICYHAAQEKNNAAVLIVGHEPDLSILIGKIISGVGPASIILAKGGLAKIKNFSYTTKPSGELQWLLTPKQILSMK